MVIHWFRFDFFIDTFSYNLIIDRIIFIRLCIVYKIMSLLDFKKCTVRMITMYHLEFKCTTYTKCYWYVSEQQLWNDFKITIFVARMFQYRRTSNLLLESESLQDFILCHQQLLIWWRYSIMINFWILFILLLNIKF